MSLSRLKDAALEAGIGELSIENLVYFANQLGITEEQVSEAVTLFLSVDEPYGEVFPPDDHMRQREAPPSRFGGKVPMRTFRHESLVEVPRDVIHLEGEKMWIESIEPWVETGSFEWMRGKEYHVPEGMSGHLYAFRTLAIGRTHSGAEWTEEEKMKAARTLIGQKSGLDHKYAPDPNRNRCIDAEYWDHGIEGFMYIEDEQMNQLFADGRIIGVSVEYFPRHEQCVGPLCTVMGNRFCGIDFVSDRYKMGDPTSTLIRVETVLDPDDSVSEGEVEMTEPEETANEEEIVEEQEEVVEETLQDDEAVEAPEEEAEQPSRHDLRLTKVETMLGQLGGAIDRLEARMEALEKEPDVVNIIGEQVLEEERDEILLDFDGGDLELSAEEVASDEDSEAMQELRILQGKRRLRTGRF
jgi:hypothetical protein